MAALPIIGIALGAIGQGVAYVGQQQAAKTQALFANLNAQAGLAQSQMQGRLAIANAAFQTQQAKNTQQAGQVNADALRSEAEARTRAAQINIARKQQDQDRFNSMLQARGAKSGAVNDIGSPLDILSYSAELEQNENAEALYQNEMERRSIYRQAQAEELGADRAGIQGEIYGMEGLARASAYRAQGVQAQLQGISGVQQARGASMSAFGGLVGGLGGLAYQGAQALRWSGNNTPIG